MNIVTFNVRECGNSVKKSLIRQLLHRGKIEMCFIQEPKVEKMNEEIIASIWGPSDLEWSAKGSEGRPGGILIIWRKVAITLMFSFKGKGYLGINAIKKGMNYFLNVYSPCDLSAKKVLWLELLKIKKSFAKGGSASSRLDRFLISDRIIQQRNVVAQITRDRDISDHRPIWIKASNLDWGPKPFKVFNSWFQHKDFLNFVKAAWDLRKKKMRRDANLEESYKTIFFQRKNEFCLKASYNENGVEVTKPSYKLLFKISAKLVEENNKLRNST
ncbi:uncharacterized protein LOC131655044 [Vicia villosa]|uniref:uncharacterized protein LOC131655044 n=1 Tax=Vicia villosa TaxID=3911 RepID=UPI00273BA1D0|nr:uncharacterized protein LOC131655044 [Vicia villosa]